MGNIYEEIVECLNTDIANLTDTNTELILDIEEKDSEIEVLEEEIDTMETWFNCALDELEIIHRKGGSVEDYIVKVQEALRHGEYK